jgi:hypothetical protein
MTNCLQNIHKRLPNLHESLSQFIPDFNSVLPQYVPQSVGNELPGSTTYRTLMHKHGEPVLTKMISDLFNFCSVQTKSPLNPGDVGASHKAYGDLYLAADALSRSRFLNELIRDPSDPTRKTRAEKLKQRLLKVCQYYGDIGKVITNVKRWFPHGTIPYRWAHVINNRDEETVEISLRVEAAL